MTPTPRARAADAVQRTLRRLGYELRPWEPGGSLREEERRRARLLAHLGIGLVLDVGANAGQYAERTRRVGYGGRIVSFEPVSAPFASLSAAAAADPFWEARRLAIGEDDGEIEINVAGNEAASSSVLAMGERHLESAPDSAYVGTERVAVARLDTLWDELAGDGSPAVWLKLDVQGYELPALRGAGSRLGEVAAVQCELSLVPLYEGGAGWREVVDFLGERGFEPAGVEPGFEDVRTGRVLQVDGVFVRS